VVGTLKKNVLSGDCFLFTNRTRVFATLCILFFRVQGGGVS
jgi:hypothetical protein